MRISFHNPKVLLYESQTFANFVNIDKIEFHPTPEINYFKNIEDGYELIILTKKELKLEKASM